MNTETHHRRREHEPLHQCGGEQTAEDSGHGLQREHHRQAGEDPLWRKHARDVLPPQRHRHAECRGEEGVGDDQRRHRQQAWPEQEQHTAKHQRRQRERGIGDDGDGALVGRSTGQVGGHQRQKCHERPRRSPPSGPLRRWCRRQRASAAVEMPRRRVITGSARPMQNSDQARPAVLRATSAPPLRVTPTSRDACRLIPLPTVCSGAGDEPPRSSAAQPLAHAADHIRGAPLGQTHHRTIVAKPTAPRLVRTSNEGSTSRPS